ncbi:Neoverrucotoxin subunit beta [Porphyridium purpureum]|uniref:Neoverrucotoxin subunit beta n=1 Tax=Porphyridium purpureum TaxID=35688 RepID=A0A5J4YT51_PORPP|nr:Neoverrucotoxin subunit beta [Porphyridium purpureum]|eukprot:POR3246..scf229_5
MDPERNGSPRDVLVIEKPALGQNVELGQMYDARTGQILGGMSLWDIQVANEILETKNHEAPRFEDADLFNYSCSIEEAREKAGLNAEDCLLLDLGLLKARGSATHVSITKKSTYEASVHATCTIVRRTRRIPQNVLANLDYGAHLNNPLCTHFVGEVREGGSVTFSFTKRCSSSIEVGEVSGELVKKLQLAMSGEARVGDRENDSTIFENIDVSCSGAFTEIVSTVDDVCRVAATIPTKLIQQTNTLSFRLFPVALLDPSLSRDIRKLDTALVRDAAAALEAGKEVRRRLEELAKESSMVHKRFPDIKMQVENLHGEFTKAETEFTSKVCGLLPELRDNRSPLLSKSGELEHAVALYKQRTSYAAQFIDVKVKEAKVLQATVSELLDDGFENLLADGTETLSMVGPQTLMLLLSLCCSEITRTTHPLQNRMANARVSATVLNGDSIESDSTDDDSCDEGDEWFDQDQTISRVGAARDEMRHLRARLRGSGAMAPQVSFGVASVKKALRLGDVKRKTTYVGDIVLIGSGPAPLVVSGLLPGKPPSPAVIVIEQTASVSWSLKLRSEAQEEAMPTTSFVVRYRPRPNAARDGAIERVSDNEAFMEMRVDLAAATAVANGEDSTRLILGNLLDNCDYEVCLCVETIVGPSEWSAATIVRTSKLPSTATRMIDFFNHGSINRQTMQGDSRPWHLTSDVQPTLYLGNRTIATRKCGQDTRFPGELAIRVVDVAPEFMPEVTAHNARDEENTKIIVFVGASGHGKSTQINAFFSYLLGGELDDSARIMVIDDRGADQAKSVTKYITCYRVRPFSPLFEGKTLWIVDTPGYGDSESFDRDRYISVAMHELFGLIKHVHAIVFTCRANEIRTTILQMVATQVFDRFARNLRGCLRTIYTFSDVGTPQARRALEAVGWPVDNGDVEVNNAAFGVAAPANAADPKIRDWWKLSMNGQARVLSMLFRMSPLPTDPSRNVTETRLELDQKCDLVEKKILLTANDAQVLRAQLGALAGAVGAAPGQKVEVKTVETRQEDLPSGKFTTLCTNCHRSCHEICSLKDDADKIRCWAMDSDGHCRICKGHCLWTAHKNTTFILRPFERTQYMVPQELINRWDKNNKLLEAALLNMIERYINLQKDLRADIMYLAELTERLKKTALLYNPALLLNYIDSLIHTSRARGASAEQIAQLTTAKNTLLILKQVKESGGENAARDSLVLADVLGKVMKEMTRRTKLDANQRAEEEDESCGLYNELWTTLPDYIQTKAPAKLKTGGLFNLGKGGAKYAENLKAVVELVKLILTDGGVLAELAKSLG